MLTNIEELNKDFKQKYQQITEDPANYDFGKNISLQEEKFKHLQNALALKSNYKPSLNSCQLQENSNPSKTRKRAK